MPDLQPEDAANVAQRAYLALHVTFADFMNVYKHLLLSLLLCLAAMPLLQGQTYREEIAGYREKQLEEITAGPESPLRPEDAAGISFFDADAKYLVRAQVELLKGEKPFMMPTYAGTNKEFIRYARLHFEAGGVKNTLIAYRDLSIPGPLARLRNILFIPFRDKTNGSQTYGGGRYLDLTIAAQATEVLLDFNKAYNPYCAYSDGYQCPVPPRENHLSVEIPAGEKKYTGAIRKRSPPQPGKQ